MKSFTHWATGTRKKKKEYYQIIVALLVKYTSLGPTFWFSPFPKVSSVSQMGYMRKKSEFHFCPEYGPALQKVYFQHYPYNMLWVVSTCVSGSMLDNTGKIVLQYNTGGYCIGNAAFSERSNTEYQAILEKIQTN